MNSTASELVTYGRSPHDAFIRRLDDQLEICCAFCQPPRYVYTMNEENLSTLRRHVAYTHTPSASHVAPGTYVYKEKLYQVLMLAVMHGEREVLVVYIPLYAVDGQQTPTVRTLENFASRFKRVEQRI
jgi:hypothetical protein